MGKRGERSERGVGRRRIWSLKKKGRERGIELNLYFKNKNKSSYNIHANKGYRTLIYYAYEKNRFIFSYLDEQNRDEKSSVQMI